MTSEQLTALASQARVVLLGYDEYGITHVPLDPPDTVFNESACSPFPDTLRVVVKHMPNDTPLTCIECIACHYDELWTVLSGTYIRVD